MVTSAAVNNGDSTGPAFHAADRTSPMLAHADVLRSRRTRGLAERVRGVLAAGAGRVALPLVVVGVRRDRAHSDGMQFLVEDHALALGAEQDIEQGIQDIQVCRAGLDVALADAA